MLLKTLSFCTLLALTSGVCKSGALSDAEQAVLKTHNNLRGRHEETADLCYAESGDDITFTSESWVQSMADEKIMKHSPKPKDYGENLAFRGSGTPGTLPGQTVAYIVSSGDWYFEEIGNWNFSSSESTGGVSRHFTQVVWKETKQVNCGYATVEDNGLNDYYVVCQYFPAGNTIGAYAANVAPLKGGSDGSDGSYDGSYDVGSDVNPTSAADLPTSTSLAIGGWWWVDPNPFPVIDRFTSSKEVANVGDSVEFDCEASDKADHDPYQEYPDHDLVIEISFVRDRDRDLGAAGWSAEVETGKKRRPSGNTGAVDITERARTYLYKGSVTVEDAGYYACRACIYRGTENESCDVDNRQLLLRIVSETTLQESPAPPFFTIERPRSTCQVFGDPQVLTFDQHFYRLPASYCDYILALDAEQGAWFIYGRTRPCGDKAAGFCLASVTIYTQHDIVELMRGWVINYHGENIETRDQIGEREIGPFRASFIGTNLQVKVLLGEAQDEQGDWEQDWLVVGWDGFTAVTIQTPRTTRTMGACGNNDQDPNNEFYGYIVYLYGFPNYDVTSFANSLQVYGRQRCEPGTEPLGYPELLTICGKNLRNAQMKCTKIFSNREFQYCSVDKLVYIEACIYDECKGFNIRNTAYPWMVIPKVDRLLKPGCAAAEAYAYKCSGAWWDLEGTKYARVVVEGWERETFSCPSPETKKLHIPRMGCLQSFMPEDY